MGLGHIWLQTPGAGKGERTPSGHMGLLKSKGKKSCTDNLPVGHLSSLKIRSPRTSSRSGGLKHGELDLPQGVVWEVIRAESAGIIPGSHVCGNWESATHRRMEAPRSAG